MLQFLVKLNLYKKLGPETVHYHHTKKYFLYWNITLNYLPNPQNQYQGLLNLEMPLVASNAHIMLSLFHPLWKIVNDSKSYVPTVPMIISFQVLQIILGQIHQQLTHLNINSCKWGYSKLPLEKLLLISTNFSLREKHMSK